MYWHALKCTVGLVFIVNGALQVFMYVCMYVCSSINPSQSSGVTIGTRGPLDKVSRWIPLFSFPYPSPPIPFNGLLLEIFMLAYGIYTLWHFLRFSNGPWIKPKFKKLPGTRASLHSGAPGVCRPCSPYCYTPRFLSVKSSNHPLAVVLKAIADERPLLILAFSSNENFCLSRPPWEYVRRWSYHRLWNIIQLNKRVFNTIRDVHLQHSQY